jgi:hypothetical protein
MLRKISGLCFSMSWGASDMILWYAAGRAVGGTMRMVFGGRVEGRWDAMVQDGFLEDFLRAAKGWTCVRRGRGRGEERTPKPVMRTLVGEFMLRYVLKLLKW